jgi:hypothetical protein|tara:strand:+ start:414 stop:848 length:435 start_codon:yes stop_codon:yes gene_type:complete
MKSAKTALGRTINMAALAAKNETTRAVSNIPVNARGDIIDNRGNVTISKEEIAKEFNKDMIIGVEESISIKEESVTTSTKKKNKKTESTIDSDVFDINNGTTDDVSIDEKVVEVNRILRTREDGSSYHEIEYSDGSMTEEFYQQ